jgi:thiol-disulfide isomerase/thioredoxin
MITRPVVLSAILGYLILSANSLVAAGSADTQWAELETLMKGPKERPKTQDEAKALVKKYIAEFDTKAAEFRKAYPQDPRRWKITLQEIQTNAMRSMVDLPKKSEADVAKACEEILAAPDADKETKSFASFLRASAAEGDEANFTKLAEAHLKEYPDFRGNKQLESMLKTKAAERDLKTKPLELSFAAVDGKAIDVAKLRGKVVLIDFWATWCGPCVAEVPNVVASYGKLHDKGFEIVGISFDQDKGALEKFTKEKGMTWPQYFDGKGWQNQFGQKFGINSIPRMWLVNKQGMVVDTNGREDLQTKVEKLLAE